MSTITINDRGEELLHPKQGKTSSEIVAAGVAPRATELDAHVHWYSLKLAWRMAAPERRHISVWILVIILVFQILLKKVAYK
jgi:hypothetical protein